MEKSEYGFTIRKAAGDEYETRTIINATGSFHNPYTPNISGKEVFQGEVFHSSAYRNPDRYRGQRVVVVGRGNSAVQIAIELADSSHTLLAVLRPVQLTKTKVLGINLHFWIRAVGLDTFPFWRFGKKPPSPSSVADLADYRARLTAGKPDQRAMFASSYSEGVVWPDETKEPVQTVIFGPGIVPICLPFIPSGRLTPKGNRYRQQESAFPFRDCIMSVWKDSVPCFRHIKGEGPDAKYVVRKLRRYVKNHL